MSQLTRIEIAFGLLQFTISEYENCENRDNHEISLKFTLFTEITTTARYLQTLIIQSRKVLAFSKTTKQVQKDYNLTFFLESILDKDFANVEYLFRESL